jgi:hypothetical protein
MGTEKIARPHHQRAHPLVSRPFEHLLHSDPNGAFAGHRMLRRCFSDPRAGVGTVIIDVAGKNESDAAPASGDDHAFEHGDREPAPILVTGWIGRVNDERRPRCCAHDNDLSHRIALNEGHGSDPFGAGFACAGCRDSARTCQP